MAQMKKAAPKRVTSSRRPSNMPTGPRINMPKKTTDKPGVKVNMPKKTTDKPSVKINMAKKVAKKVKVEGPSDYRPNEIYNLPFTPAQQKAFGKLKMSPKTADTVFTTPKGIDISKMSKAEIKQMQNSRIADRKRTLARAANIIRRTVR